MQRTEPPIGVFDSGVGGLTVLSALSRRLPREREGARPGIEHVPDQQPGILPGERKGSRFRRQRVGNRRWPPRVMYRLPLIISAAESARVLAASRRHQLQGRLYARPIRRARLTRIGDEIVVPPARGAAARYVVIVYSTDDLMQRAVGDACEARRIRRSAPARCIGRGRIDRRRGVNAAKDADVDGDLPVNKLLDQDRRIRRRTHPLVLDG